MQITAQSGFDRLNEFWINIELRDYRTANRVPEFFRTIDTLEQSLRTFGETFTLFIQLTQYVQPRSLFGECALERGKILFRLNEYLLLFAKAGLDVDRLGAPRFERNSDLADDFVAGFGQHFDFP